jgi:hypothetical protein
VISVKVSTSDRIKDSGLFLRQIFNENAIWGNCKFYVNQPVSYCDWWIVCHNSALINPDSTICDPEHIVFISMEPTDSGISSRFFNQFSQLVICDRNVSHKNIKYANGTTWWVGIKVRHENGHIFSPEYTLNYHKLNEIAMPAKQNRISVICSRNQSLPGHTKRLKFLDKLMGHPVSKHIDFYGGGYNAIPDKWDGIAPYKYHLVLENSIVPDYWSEKLGDAFLGFSFPIYYGCPNINDYFNTDSLAIIDIEKFDQTVSILEQMLSEDKYEDHIPAIIDARNKVLNDYNIFQLMSEICYEPARKFTKCKLKPVSHFERSWPRRTARRLIYVLKSIK